MALPARLHKRRSQHSDRVAVLQTLTQKPHNSSSTGTPLAAVHPMEPRMSAGKWVSLCAGPLRVYLGFQQPSISPRCVESLLMFAARFCDNSSSRCWCSGPGTLVSGGDSSFFSGGERGWNLQLREPSWLPTIIHGCWASLFYVSTPLISPYMASSLYP